MGIRFSAMLILLLLVNGIAAQQDTSKIYNWQGRQVRYLKIEKGKTLYSISKQYSVAQDTLIAWNPQLESGLKTDMVLRIPLPLEKPSGKSEPALAKKQVVKEEKPALKKPPEDAALNNNEEIYECRDLSPEEMRRELKIVLFLPFYISADGGLNPKSHIGLDFYSGARIALDSLSRRGFNVKVQVYDTRNDTAAVLEALRKPECRGADLIVGPLYSSGFKPVAEFARKNNICAISPFSQSDAILQSFENVIKLTPDQETLLENLCITTVGKRPEAQYVLLRNSNEKDKAITNHMASVLKRVTNHKNFREINFKNASSLLDSLDNIKDNIIFFPSSVQVQVIDLVSRLSAAREGKQITLIGLQEWNNYENIDFDHLNNLHFTYASSYFSDHDAHLMKQFRSTFKQEFKTEPGNYAIQGYDVVLQFGMLTARYGKNFYHCLERLPAQCGLGTCYRFVRNGKKSGLENHAIQVISLKDFVATPVFK
jgi:ABC-type branched-subunit amino acid transport system substrate-binding protein